MICGQNQQSIAQTDNTKKWMHGADLRNLLRQEIQIVLLLQLRHIIHIHRNLAAVRADSNLRLSDSSS